MTKLAPAPAPPQNMASTAALLSEWPRIKFQPAGDRNKFWTVWFETSCQLNQLMTCSISRPETRACQGRMGRGPFPDKRARWHQTVIHGWAISIFPSAVQGHARITCCVMRRARIQQLSMTLAFRVSRDEGQGNAPLKHV